MTASIIQCYHSLSHHKVLYSSQNVLFLCVAGDQDCTSLETDIVPGIEEYDTVAVLGSMGDKSWAIAASSVY